MKAFITAFALLGFVAVSTLPVVAHADTRTTQTAPKKHNKKHGTKTVAKNAHHHGSKAKHKKSAGATG